MVIDTSALLAILFAEPDRELFISALETSGSKLLSSVNAIESAIVAEARKGPAAGRELDLLLHRARIDIVPVDNLAVEEAMRVWRAFGKGNHPASLNFCDCCAVALSRISGRPLLFKGEGFVRAEAISALDPR